MIDDAIRERLDTRIAELVERAIGAALDAAPPDASVAFREVFAPVDQKAEKPAAPAILEKKEGAKEITTSTPSTRRSRGDGTRRVRGPHGAGHRRLRGPFRTTKGLYSRWPDRVLDTPIAPRAA